MNDRTPDDDTSAHEKAPTISRPANSNVPPTSLYNVPDDKIVTGTIINYGTAPYKFDKGNNPSFYLNIRNGDTTRTLWGIDLERALTESSYDIGDEVAIYDRGKVPAQVMAKIRDTKGKVIRQEMRTVMKGAWHIGAIEEYSEARSLQRKRDKQREASTQQNFEEQASHGGRASPEQASSRHPASRAEYASQVKTHFSAAEFEIVEQIWKDVPRRTSVHNDTGYHLIVDEKRTVIVTSDEITLASNPKHRLDQSYAASCEHARRFWDGKMEAHGDRQHCIMAWAYASVYGVQVTNFSPTADELTEAEKIMAGLRETMGPMVRRPTGARPAQPPAYNS